MNSYSKLFEIYQNAEMKPVDAQLLINCTNGAYIPLEVLLGQYKTLVKSQPTSQEYKTVRNYLTSIFSEQIINDMEAV